jgi:hypothetical protein
MRIIRILFAACFCVIAAGCVSSAIDHYSGKYRNMFVANTTRDEFRAKLGTPVKTWTFGSTNLAEYGVSGIFTYDVFAVRGKISKPGDGSAQATVNAVSLGTSEAIMIPLTIVGTISQSTQRHTLVVFYDTTLHYSRHELYDKNGHQEDTLGY